MRWGVNYSNLIALGANSLGIYLSVSWLLRAGHPSLFIPLEEISVIPVDSFDVLRASQPPSVRLGVIFGKREKRSWFNYVKLQFDKCPTIHLLIPINVAEKLSQASAFRFSSLKKT